jgi:hypothetical protein
MCLWSNQKEVLKLHTFRRRAVRQLDTLALSEKECNGISQLHARKVNANTRPCTHTEGMEGRFSGRRERFSGITFLGGDPSLGVEAGCYC